MNSGAEDVGIDDVQFIATIISGGGSVITPATFTSTVSDITISTDDVSGKTVTFDKPVSDKGVVSCDHTSGDTFAVGTTTVICTATHSDGNTMTSFDVIVILVLDTMPPVISAPIDKTFEATDTLTILNSSQIGFATVTDNRDDSPIISNNATSSFPLGNTVILWTATDDSNNFSTATQTIIIQDTLSPVISTSVNIMSSSSTVPFDTPLAIDLVDGTVVDESN